MPHVPGGATARAVSDRHGPSPVHSANFSLLLLSSHRHGTVIEPEIRNPILRRILLLFVLLLFRLAI